MDKNLQTKMIDVLKEHMTGVEVGAIQGVLKENEKLQRELQELNDELLDAEVEHKDLVKRYEELEAERDELKALKIEKASLDVREAQIRKQEDGWTVRQKDHELALMQAHLDGKCRTLEHVEDLVKTVFRVPQVRKEVITAGVEDRTTVASDGYVSMSPHENKSSVTTTETEE